MSPLKRATCGVRCAVLTLAVALGPTVGVILQFINLSIYQFTIYLENLEGEANRTLVPSVNWLDNSVVRRPVRQ